MDRLLILTGPTASGKTSVSCRIAKILPIEMVSFDSMQVYRRMPILTQVPTLPERRLLKAKLVSFIDPSRMYDAAQFRSDALSRIERILRAGRVPLLSGGTGLYLRMLLDGLFETPEPSSDLKLRARLLRQQEREGGAFLHDRLKALDPVSAARIHPNDHRRLVRAIEVCQLTGKSFSEQRARREGIRDRFDCPIFFLDRDREDLYRRIDARVDAMMSAGLLREVKRLRKTKLSMTASQALGLRQLGEYLDGRMSLEESVALLKQHTRNYAKRQVSWFRHEKDVRFVSVSADETPAKTARRIVDLWKEAGR